MKSVSISQIQKNIRLLSCGEDLLITSHGFVVGTFNSQTKREKQMEKINKVAGIEPPVSIAPNTVQVYEKAVKKAWKGASAPVSDFVMCPCGTMKSTCPKHMFSK